MQHLKDRSLIHIYGADAQQFLQNMVSNDVIKNKFSYNFLLSNQGRYIFDFFVIAENDQSYFVDIDEASSVLFIKRMNMYKLRRDLTISNVSADYCIMYSNASAIKKPQIDCKFYYQDPRYNKMGYRSLISAKQLSSIEVLELDLYNMDKYEHYIPDGASDLIKDKSIPIEYGAEELNAIDYQKGCYVGQEVISRAKYQGVVRKKIFGLAFESETKASTSKTNEAVINQSGEKVGVICSTYKNKAIALIRTEKLNADKHLLVDGAQVKIIAAAYY